MEQDSPAGPRPSRPVSYTHLDVYKRQLELSEVFDRGELIRKLSAMEFAHHGPLVLSGASGSMLVSLLDDERFLQLPADTTSAEGVALSLIHI